tara:strand:- start:2398 stop:2949 length:552 start_codon:yes stop_codon:yes gene_type:complete
MKKILTTLLLFLSLISFSQEYYRDTIIERAIFNEVNRHRDSVGVHIVKFNPDNTRAVSWGEVLIQNDLDGNLIYHCGCAAGIEIIALTVVGDDMEVTMSVKEIAKQMVSLWDNSLSHKKGMESKYMTRGFNSVYIFKSPRVNNRYVAVSVFQFLRDKDYYTNLDWDENEKVPNVFLTDAHKTN